MANRLATLEGSLLPTGRNFQGRSVALALYGPQNAPMDAIATGEGYIRRNRDVRRRDERFGGWAGGI